MKKEKTANQYQLGMDWDARAIAKLTGIAFGELGNCPSSSGFPSDAVIVTFRGGCNHCNYSITAATIITDGTDNTKQSVLNSMARSAMTTNCKHLARFARSRDKSDPIKKMLNKALTFWEERSKDAKDDDHGERKSRQALC
jgi:hypothetical protein